MKSYRITLALGLLLSIPALAQSPIQFVSSTVKAGQPVPQSCLAEAAVFQTKLALYPQLKNWTNVMICDEFSWQKVIDTPGHKYLMFGNFVVDVTARSVIYNGDDFTPRKLKMSGTKWAAANAPAAPAQLPTAPVMADAGGLQ